MGRLIAMKLVEAALSNPFRANLAIDFFGRFSLTGAPVEPSQGRVGSRGKALRNTLGQYHGRRQYPDPADTCFLHVPRNDVLQRSLVRDALHIHMHVGTWWWWWWWWSWSWSWWWWWWWSCA